MTGTGMAHDRHRGRSKCGKSSLQHIPRSAAKDQSPESHSVRVPALSWDGLHLTKCISTSLQLLAALAHFSQHYHHPQRFPRTTYCSYHSCLSCASRQCHKQGQGGNHPISTENKFKKIYSHFSAGSSVLCEQSLCDCGSHKHQSRNYTWLRAYFSLSLLSCLRGVY